MLLSKYFKITIKALALITCVIGLNGCNNKTAETANATDNTIIEISTETEPLKPNTTVETLIENLFSQQQKQLPYPRTNILRRKMPTTRLVIQS